MSTSGTNVEKANRDFADLFACFARRDVRALIVGAHAVAFHAKPRYTKDIDVLVDSTRDNAERLIEALADFGFASLGLRVEDFLQPETIIQLGIAPNRIDLLTSISGVSFEEAWRGRVAGRYGGHPVAFIGIDALRTAKAATGRPQDLADLAWLSEKVAETEDNGP